MISFQTAIACDQVRMEIDGKLILIGCYNGGIGVASFPVEMEMSWAVITDMQAAGKARMSFRVVGEGRKKPLAELASEIEVVEPEIGAIIPIPQTEFTINSPMKLSLQGRVDSGKWKVLKRLDISQADRPAPVST